MLQLYKNIKEKRLELNLTQSELADRLGYADKSMIAKIEKGNIDLPQSKIVAFAKALETTPSYLMGWNEDETDEKPITVAAHKDNGNFTSEELTKIEEYKNLLLAARPKPNGDD